MITGLIRRQELILSSPMIVADTIDYLTAQFVFQTSDWDGASKYSHWKCGDLVYDVPLTGDRIGEGAHLNLSAGVWKVWIHGEKYADGNLIQRITTQEATLTVKSTGTIGGEPFPELPESEIERIHAQIAELEGAKLDPVAKTDDMTQPVGRDEQGRLFTAPSSGGGGGTGLPTITEADEGRVLTASGGVAVWRDLPKYTGEYSVTPEVDTAQTLETAGTYMTNDVTVKAIPDYEVSNEAGGNTFIIGKEII